MSRYWDIGTPLRFEQGSHGWFPPKAHDFLDPEDYEWEFVFREYKFIFLFFVILSIASKFQ